MRILMLGWELPPVNSGGLGVACYYLCRQLADAGVSIDFLMPHPLPPDHTIDFMQVHAASEIQAPSIGTGAYDNWNRNLQRQQHAYARKMKQLIAAHNYDVIHAHDWLTLEAGVQAKKLTGKPLVAHVHSTEYDRAGGNSGNPLVHEIEQTCLLMADRIVAVSNATKIQLINNYNVPAQAIDVVYSASGAELVATSAVADTDYVYLRKMQARGYKVVVSLGRLTIQKGLHFLLHAAKLALEQNPKLIFLIAGDGEQRDELVNLTAELGIPENIIFTGFLRGKAWRDTYAVGDMFIMSSVSEPYGLTALEAASSGTAVLLTKQSGVSEVLRHSLQFDFWDTEKLADYIVNVAEHDALRYTLSTQAMQEIRGISWAKAAARLQAIYGAVKVLA